MYMIPIRRVRQYENLSILEESPNSLLYELPLESRLWFLALTLLLGEEIINIKKVRSRDDVFELHVAV